MNVLVVPEDFRKDQYLLKPIVEALVQEAGCRTARVRICTDPLLGSVEQALSWDRIQGIVEDYRGMVDLFLLIVDRDGVEGRRAALDRIEGLALAALPARRGLLGENAWQEVEVWALAGAELPADWAWQDIRSEVHAKERYFEAHVASRGLTHEPAEGRATLGREAARRIKRLCQLCPEDLGALLQRIRVWAALTS